MSDQRISEKISDLRLDNLIAWFDQDTPDPTEKGTQVWLALRELRAYRKEGWQPIETAPEGEIVVVTDGLVWGAARKWRYVEPEIIGFDPRKIGMKISALSPNTERPNPDAGKVTWHWSAICGWSGWDEGTAWEDGEYEQRTPKLLNPTHWMPLPAAPSRPRATGGYEAMNRVFLFLKRLLGFRMTYGEIAEIAGDGPCRRCVGRALADLP